MTRYIIILLLTLVPQWIFAAETTGESPDMLKDMMANVLVLSVAITAFVALYMIARVTMMMMSEVEGKYQVNVPEPIPAVVSEPTISWWSKLWSKLDNSAPIHKEADIMLDHNYDGIRELDNSLPPWWVAMFYITIFIGLVYIGYYHVWEMGPGQIAAYEQEVEYAENARAAILAMQANKVDESNVTILTDEQSLTFGANIYNTNCTACHGASGEGGVGPNLTDEYWLHGGHIKSVFKVIKYGVPEKGMIAWSNQMSARDIHLVASYIMTLKGTNPPNGKAPQGIIYDSSGEEGEDQTIGLK
ncbi:MAG: cbb3-type cytochrome c oxidase N-terminal domain-containing protein [Bacteroidota bacterium]